MIQFEFNDSKLFKNLFKNQKKNIDSNLDHNFDPRLYKKVARWYSTLDKDVSKITKKEAEYNRPEHFLKFVYSNAT